METLKNLNKLWRSSALLPATTTTYSDAAAAERVLNKGITTREYEEDVEEDEEESFFELELVMLNNTKTITKDKENEGFRLSSKDAILGRRVVPVEPDLKPHLQSPISILKSAPKFKVSLFRKPKDDPNSDLKPKPKTDDEKYTFNKAPTATISTLIRESISPVPKPKTQNISKTEDDSSKRFSKDVMHNYLKLKLIKPFHLKAAKRSTTNKSRPFESKDDCSVSSSPAPSLKLRSSSGGFRVVCKQLGKSRSASSMVIGSRRVESVEHDDGGIQSAILHCKRSFNSSRDNLSMHSRSSSDSREQEPNIDN